MLVNHKESANMINTLEWQTIYYQEEHDTDGSILHCEWTQEAKYRGGFLIKHTHQSADWNISESITFIDGR